MTEKENVNGKLMNKLHELRQAKGDKISLDDIGSILESLIGTLQGDVCSSDLMIQTELREIGTRIQQLRQEISSIGTKEGKHLPTATMELDAVVKSTEEATNGILDAADEISTLISQIPAELQERFTEQVTRIFEACNFQDITGQRIRKVVSTLAFIENKITRLNTLLDAEGGALSTDDTAENPDADLLNGPQLPDQAPDQSEIDKLFAQN
ncbi:MAG: protein phosphatase CheZ [Alphaproteobacteria bacterium]|nr:protein phosphatase CheZ [Alphaproteobacteria bacterium]